MEIPKIRLFLVTWSNVESVPVGRPKNWIKKWNADPEKSQESKNAF